MFYNSYYIYFVYCIFSYILYNLYIKVFGVTQESINILQQLSEKGSSVKNPSAYVLKACENKRGGKGGAEPHSRYEAEDPSKYEAAPCISLYIYRFLIYKNIQNIQTK